MIDIRDITPGKSYACKFVLRNIPLDGYGRPGGLMSMADVPVQKYGDYESLGILLARDMEKELVELEDTQSDGKPKKYVVPFADIWDVDDVEWVEDGENEEDEAASEA